MHFDFNQIDAKIAYRLLTATINPRPIAWVTSVAHDGVVNAAPFSFFNIMGHNPPTVAIGLMRQEQGPLKDTAQNIIDNQEFVINLVSEQQAQDMNATCAALPPDVNELAAANIATRPALFVQPPLIAHSPVSMECVSQATVVTGPNQIVVIGRILHFHIDDQYVVDAEKGYVDTLALNLISRMHGSGWYARSTDLFQLDRPKHP